MCDTDLVSVDQQHFRGVIFPHSVDATLLPMYIPKHFEETRVAVLHDLMRAHPLASFVTLGRSGLDANHIPFEIVSDPEPLGTLRGHVARANPIWRDFTPDVEALAIFQGPNAYISPSWYATKSTTGQVVPTWNYAVVHAHGPLRVIEDRAWLRALVEGLTNRHEAGMRQPWNVKDAPEAYIDNLLGSIVGLEMPISRLSGKWKVSQNRPVSDRQGSVDGLLAQGSEAAAAMAALIQRADHSGS
jgi:transcriptional regulator